MRYGCGVQGALRDERMSKLTGKRRWRGWNAARDRDLHHTSRRALRTDGPMRNSVRRWTMPVRILTLIACIIGLAGSIPARSYVPGSHGFALLPNSMGNLHDASWAL